MPGFDEHSHAKNNRLITICAVLDTEPLNRQHLHAMWQDSRTGFLDSMNTLGNDGSLHARTVIK